MIVINGYITGEDLSVEYKSGICVISSPKKIKCFFSDENEPTLSSKKLKISLNSTGSQVSIDKEMIHVTDVTVEEYL